jgi:hypothetical protein
MEQYINDDTIIKDAQYEVFKDLIYCQICECLMIEPVMCFNCQNNFCKKCINDWKSRNANSCPNRCENPIYRDVIGKNRLISKFKFKCIKGCGAEIPFEDINNHYKSNCIENKKNDSNATVQKNETKREKSSITILSKEQTQLKTKDGAKIDRMTSKNKSFNLI